VAATASLSIPNSTRRKTRTFENFPSSIPDSAGIIAQTTARTRTINFGDVSQFQSEMSHNFKSENSLIAKNSDGTVTFTMEDEDSMNSANKDSSNQAMKM